MVSKVVFILVVTTALCNAFVPLVPQDKELVYHYKTVVAAGTQKPTTFASVFVLEGNLHVQAVHHNITYFKLTDLHYRIYNGPIANVHEPEVTEVPMPEEMADLQKAFKVVYDHHGRVVSLTTDIHVKEYVRNIKKAIASVWQLDVEDVVSHDKAHSFVTEEDSIYGIHDVIYNIIPQDTSMMVRKVHELENVYDVMTNVELLPVEDHIIKPLSRMAHHEYVISKHGDHNVVDRISGIGEVFYYPYKGESDAQYVYVNQTFELHETLPVQEHYSVQQGVIVNNLLYNMFEYSDVGVIPDITHGRRYVDWQVFMPKIQNMLKEVWVYFDVDHMHPVKPDIREAQLVSRMIRLMQLLDHTRMEELYNLLKAKTSDVDVKVMTVFYKMLPMIGTEASTKFIKKLVLEKMVDNHIAIEMLQEMPRNVIMPMRTIVKEMEDLAHSKDTVQWNVHKVSVLAFSSLVHKAHVHEMQVLHKQHHDQHQERRVSHMRHDNVQVEGVNDIHQNVYHHENHQHDSHHVEEHLTNDNHIYHYNVEETTTEDDILHFYEQYVLEFVTKLRQTQNKDEQLLYMNALHNMRIHTILSKHLVGGINGEWWPQDHHMRFLAMWAVRPLVQEHPEFVHEVFWPILVNHNEHSVLRMFAYHMIMESHPAQQTLLTLYWFMMKVHDYDLYHFHYTYFDSLRHSMEPSHAIMKVKIQQLMHYMVPPVHGISTYKVIDFKGHSFDYGTGIHTMFLEDKISKYFALYTTSHVSHLQVEDHFISMKLHGLEDRFCDIFKLSSGSDIIFNFEQLMQVFINPPADAHIEIIVSKQQHVMNSYYVDSHSGLDYLQEIMNALKPSASGMSFVNYDHYFQMHMATDIGVPVMLEYLHPVVHKGIWDVQSSKVNNVDTYKIRQNSMKWSNSRQGLTVYNPILDIWQGVNKYISIDHVHPLSIDVSVPQNKIKVSMNLYDDNNRPNVVGMRYHVTSMVFVKDDMHRKLLSDGPHSGNWVVVSHGEEYRHNFTMMDAENSNSGQHTKVVLFDVEGNVPASILHKTNFDMMLPYTKNFKTPLDHLILYVVDWNQHLEHPPHHGTYGILYKVEPSTVHSATNVDVTIRMNREVNHLTHVYAPATKYSTRMTYAVKNDVQSVKTWDVNAMLEQNDGHTVNDLKVEVTRIIPGKTDYKVCVEGTKRYTTDNIEGQMKVTMGESTGGKCVNDKTVVEITMHGEASLHERTGDYAHGVCKSIVPYMDMVHHHHHTMECMAEHTNLHKYVYTVKTTDVPSEYANTLAYWWSIYQSMHISHYDVYSEHGVDLHGHQAIVEVVYSLDGQTVDIYVYKPQKAYSLTGVPISYDYWKWFGVYPESTVYPELYKTLHSIDFVNHCDIYHDHLIYNYHHVTHTVSNEWTMYVGDVADSPKNAVYVKHMGEKKMGVKVIHDNNVFEVVPHDNFYTFMMNGHQMVLNKNKYSADWITVFVIDEEIIQHPIVIHMPHFGFNIEYDGHNVYVTSPKLEHDLIGQCFSK